MSDWAAKSKTKKSRAEDEIPYPIVLCDFHPGVSLPGYVECIHIHGPQDIAYFEAATPSSMGIIVCKMCNAHAGDKYYSMDNFHSACAGCMKEKGLIPTVN